MPWVRNGKEIKIGKGWTETGSVPHEDVQHPANWASVWSEDEIKQKGLTWVDPPAAYDSRFYFAAGVERSLADSSDGTVGLKTTYKNDTNTKAYSMLQQTDWYVIRKYEDSTQDIPKKITDYRAAVRTAANSIQAKIDAASNMQEFIKLFDSADSDGITEINRWPERV